MVIIYFADFFTVDLFIIMLSTATLLLCKEKNRRKRFDVKRNMDRFVMDSESIRLMK